MQSREESFTADDWIYWDHHHPQTMEKNIQAMLQKAKEAAMKRETALSQAFSNQVKFAFFFPPTTGICSPILLLI